jgi:chaperone required for assembly of F1-ATPase
VKRFWDNATAEPTPSGHEIRLDGKPVRLPDGPVLLIGPAPLAAAIAAEWQTAGGARNGEMSFADTPLTRLAGTAQGRIALAPEATADAIARYGETDLLCYRAERPAELVAAQAQSWQPWLDWAALAYDAPLRVTQGIMHVAQDAQAVAALRETVRAMPVAVLAGLGLAVPILGSLVLGLALAERLVDAETAYALASLDERFQAEQWGIDPEAAARSARDAADVALAARFIALARS